MMNLIGLPKHNNQYSLQRGYTQLVFLASKKLQSTELAELQSQIYQDIQSATSNMQRTLLLDGGGIDVVNATAFISKAKAVIEGSTIEIPAADITLTGGKTSIGILVQYELVTYTEDASLKDPAVGTFNFGNPGAARVKATPIWSKQPIQALPNQDYYEVFTLNDGAIVRIGPIQEYSNFAKNSNIEIIDGYKASFKEYVPSLARTVIRVQKGKALFNQTNLKVSQAQEVFLGGLVETSQVQNESFIYHANQLTYPLKKRGVSSITQISVLRVEAAPLIRGNVLNSADALPRSTVESLLSVTQGSTNYDSGADFFKPNNSSISWNLPGDEPAPGSSYSVTYQYRDTSLILYPNIDAKSLDIPLNSPIVEGSTIFVSYEHFTPRVDSIVLTQNNVVAALRGIPNKDNPVPNKNAKRIGAILANVLIQFGQEPEITNLSKTVISQEDLRSMSNRLYRLEGIVDSIKSTQELQPAYRTVKNSIWADPLSNNDKRDPIYTQNCILSKNAICVGIDTAVQVITQPLQADITPTGVSVVLSSQLKETRDLRITQGVLLAEPQELDILITPKVSIFKPTELTFNPPIKNPSLPNPQWWLEGENDFRPSTESIYDTPQKISNTRINIYATGFNANETVDITISGLAQPPVVATSTGTVNLLNYVIPTTLVEGVQEVTLIGRASLKRARDFILVTSKVQSNGQNHWKPMESATVGQTFYFNEDTVVTDIDLKIKTPSSKPILIGLAKMEGSPDIKSCIAKATIPVAYQIAGNYAKAILDVPVVCEAGTPYIFMIFTNDSNAKIRSIKKGDNSSVSTIDITKGELWTSVKGQSWSKYPEEQLVYKINGKEVASTATGVVGTITVSTITDIILSSEAAVPSSCGLVLKAVLIDRGAEEYTCELGVPVEIPVYTGQIQITYAMENNLTAYPVIPADFHIAVGVSSTNSEYITESVDLKGTDVNVVLTEDVSKIGRVTVFRQDSLGAWVLMNRMILEGHPDSEGRQKVLYSSGTLSINIQEITTRIRLVLNSLNSSDRPSIHSLGIYS